MYYCYVKNKIDNIKKESLVLGFRLTDRISTAVQLQSCQLHSIYTWTAICGWIEVQIRSIYLEA